MRVWKSTRLQLHAALVAIQMAFSGFEVLSRLILDRSAGMCAFTFYRNCIAVLVMSILAVALERKKVRLSLADAFQIFILGTLGVTMNQLLYLAGLSSTSAMFASSVRNLIPVFTFLMAMLFRKEKLNMKTRHGQAKLLGCALGMCGSILLSLYKGPVLIHCTTSPFHLEKSQAKQQRFKQCVKVFRRVLFRMDSWTLGTLCLIASCLSFSTFLVLQASLVERLSSSIAFVGLCSFSSLIQLPLLAAVFEPDWLKWKRVSTGEAIAILYAGFIASGFITAAQTWGVQKAGPVIVAAYQPMETVIAALLGLFFLQESLHLGSIIGASVVTTGLYLLIWGQERERMQQHQLQNVNLSSRSSRVHPLADDIPVAMKWKIYTVNDRLKQIDIVEAPYLFPCD